ncbi:unnamed protein product [Heterobilharzia americana]|nr:unnamed protein product [Heterobilharzia americana]
MADYWKSNPKKYCELCKCWMADNKISIQNHENGMRHKASVAKKVNELTRSKKTAETDKKSLETCLQQMNDNAHISMMKDLERDPSLAKQYGIVLAKSDTGKSNEEKSEEKSRVNKSRLDPPNPENIWKESITPDGKHYYWNVATRVTQWTRPDGVIEPDNRSVKEEKDRLKDFVLNRLVELSESGSKGANEAVLQAFNPSSVAEIEPVVDKLSADTSNDDQQLNTGKHREPVQFDGPRIDLLGPWVRCDDIPKPKLPKLDLPDTINNYTKQHSQISDVINEKLTILTQLEETTEKYHENSSLLNLKEKVIPPGCCSLGNIKKSDNNNCNIEQSNNNPARIVFRRRPTANRTIRPPQNDE